MQDEAKVADVVFKKISKELESEYFGKIVAIDADSGSYFIGNSELDAYKKAVQKYPNKKFVFKRVGSDYTHLVGAF